MSNYYLSQEGICDYLELLLHGYTVFDRLRRAGSAGYMKPRHIKKETLTYLDNKRSVISFDLMSTSHNVFVMSCTITINDLNYAVINTSCSTTGDKVFFSKSPDDGMLDNYYVSKYIVSVLDSIINKQPRRDVVPHKEVIDNSKSLCESIPVQTSAYNALSDEIDAWLKSINV